MDAMSQTAFPVTLPCGYYDSRTGQVYNTATVVTMTGATRKAVADPQVRQSAARVLDTVLLHCVKTVGPYPVTQDVVDGMTLPDRDTLVAKIREASMGPLAHVTGDCSECGARGLSVEYDFRTLTFTGPVLDAQDIRDVFGKKFQCFPLNLPKHNVKAIFRYPVGSDQHKIANIIRKNPIEAMLILMRSTVVEWNGIPVNEVSPLLFEQLPVNVLDDLNVAFRDALPGPDFRAETTCTECGAAVDIDVDASDFIFPLAPKTRRK